MSAEQCGSDSWLVFYTRPRFEKKAEQHLLEQDIEVFLPKCVKIRQWSDRKKKVIEPLFPSYIFARGDERTRLQILDTDGIARMVCFNRRPARLSAHEYEMLLKMQREPGFLEAVPAPDIPVGARVVVRDGPFEGLEGEVVRQDGEAHVCVRIDTLGQAVKVKIPSGVLRRCEPAEEV